MCGLTGVLSYHLAKEDISLFEDLMLIHTLRGRWGSGVIAVPTKEKKPIRVHRSLNTGTDIVCEDEYTKAVKLDMTCLAGHTRQPTSGGYSINEVHPHEFGDIIGMHNGTLGVVNGVPVTKNDSDSSLLFQCIAAYGLKTTVQKTKGAMAIVWVDKERDTLNFYRNAERSLYFAYPESGLDTVFWASEMRFLNCILGRGWSEKFKIIAMPHETHWAFPLRPGIGKIKVTEEKIPQATNVIALPAPVVSVPHVPLARSDDGLGSFHTTLNGQQVRTPELEGIFKKGCSNCLSQGDWADYVGDKMHFHTRTEFMCDWCYCGDQNATKIVNDARQGRRM